MLRDIFLTTVSSNSSSDILARAMRRSSGSRYDALTVFPKSIMR